MEIKEELVYWYEKNKRDLPWRNTKDPYRIWISEVILQQTRVEQGLNYYHNFIETFPNVAVLAKATENEVLKAWQGLGYYSRARNLHAAAKDIVENFEGKFPNSHADVLKLKGIGPYTAAAITSIAYNLPYAAVDGNVTRVLSRIFDIEIAINTAKGKKKINTIANQCLSIDKPGTYNQAIMELGAMVCKPRNPNCENCPLLFKCLAQKNKTTTLRPVKLKAKPPAQRYMDYAVLESETHLVFKKRTNDDIWKGLHDFVVVEGVKKPFANHIAKEVEKQIPEIKLISKPRHYHKQYIHVLSHQRITGRFWHFKINEIVKNNSVYFSVPKQEVEQLAVSRLIHKYLEEFKYI